MAISDADYKILWGRAAGLCSNPSCRADLTVLLSGDRSYNVGEMAHIIARNPGGPRGNTTGGPDVYDNLILLCPTCHRRVDKAKGEYSEQTLKQWKRGHEGEIRQQGEVKFDSAIGLRDRVKTLLEENRGCWETFGPASETATNDPGSNLHMHWNYVKLSKIIPNNNRIIRLITKNHEFLSDDQRRSFLRFKIHAAAFERHQYERLDRYPRFPIEFAEAFGI